MKICINIRNLIDALYFYNKGKKRILNVIRKKKKMQIDILNV